MSGPCTDCGGPDYQTLEAKVEELEAEVINLHSLGGAPIFSMAMGKRVVQAEAELTRARVVVILLKLAASNVLSRGRRFPPRAEWRELHTAVRGARAWLAERGAP